MQCSPHSHLAAWCAEPAVAPEVLAQARRDFGSMILTPAAIAANPPAWSGPTG